MGFVRDSNVAGLENPPNGDLLASRCPRPCGPGMEGVARQPGPDHTRSAIMLNIVELRVQLTSSEPSLGDEGTSHETTMDSASAAPTKDV